MFFTALKNALESVRVGSHSICAIIGTNLGSRLVEKFVLRLCAAAANTKVLDEDKNRRLQKLVEDFDACMKVRLWLILFGLVELIHFDAFIYVRLLLFIFTVNSLLFDSLSTSLYCQFALLLFTVDSLYFNPPSTPPLPFQFTLNTTTRNPLAPNPPTNSPFQRLGFFVDDSFSAKEVFSRSSRLIVNQRCRMFLASARAQVFKPSIDLVRVKGVELDWNKDEAEIVEQLAALSIKKEELINGVDSEKFFAFRECSIR